MRIALVILFLLFINFDNACSAGNKSDFTNLENLPPEIIAHIIGYVAEDAAKQAQAEQEKFYAKQDKVVEEYLRLHKYGKAYSSQIKNLEKTLSQYGIKKGEHPVGCFQANKEYCRKTTHVIAHESAIIKNTHALHQTCKSLNRASTPFIQKHWEKVRSMCTVRELYNVSGGFNLLKYYLKKRILLRFNLP